MRLGVIVGTIREGRQTAKQAKWVAKTAAAMDGVEVEIVDLADYPMPFFAEPVSPRYNPSRQPEPVAQKWLDKLASLDAYVFVTPEYNHSFPGVLKNALDYVDFQMVHKPSAIVSHGVVGGARAALHLKEVLSEAQTVPIPKFNAFAHMSNGIDDDGNLTDTASGMQAQLDAMLAELKWYGDVLAAARANEAQ